MKKKQVIAAILTVAMGVSLLGGCGTAKEETKNNEEGGQVKEEVKEDDLSEPVELVWYVIGTPQDDQEVVFDEVNKVLEKELNTTVDFQVIDYGSYDDKMQMMISTGESFDICFTSDWANPYVSNAQKNAFYPLTELLEKYGTNILEQVPEDYWEATKVGDEIYGVINYQISARSKGVSFPKDVVEKIGYDVSKIHSYEDMTDYFEVVKEKKPDMIPFLGFDPNSTEMPMFVEEDGYVMDYLSGPIAVRPDDVTKAFNAIESSEFMEFCKMSRDWYNKGYVRKDIMTVDGTSEKKTHDYASYTSGVGPDSEITEADTVGYEVVQTQTVPSFLSTGSIQAALSAISINSEYPERAMMVLDYLFKDKDTYNMLCYGLEGKHYNPVNEHSVDIIEDGGYIPGNQWVYGSWYNAKVVKGQSEDLWERQKAKDAAALKSPVLGFVFNPSNVKTEMAQIQALMDEYLPSLMTGVADPEEKIPELVEKMNAAGMDKIIEDANSQLVEWNKTK